ncbi:MAG: SHOCT domain-containing protein [Paludibacter sp.]|nr:SHOCT domain-containing protein [Paludibacter sp.]
MILGWIIGIVLVGVLIAVLSKGNLFKTNNQKSPKTSVGVGTAMETLKKRYAKGEIDKAEFEEKKAELEN